MYKWKITSFLVFSGMFWGVSMTSSAIAWLILSSYFASDATETEESIKKEEHEDRPIKTEEEEEMTESDFDSPHAPPGVSKQEAEQIKQEEDAEGPSGVDLQATEAENENDEDDEGQQIRESTGVGTDSGIGTSLESASARGIQRRRSRLFGGHGDGH